MKIYGLRIKKIYFDAILSGEKRFEYRKATSRYRGLSDPDVTHILLHYQTPRRLLARIVRIDVIPRPDWLDESFSPRVYRVELANPRLV
jgi:hypothetical protein